MAKIRPVVFEIEVPAGADASLANEARLVAAAEKKPKDYMGVFAPSMVLYVPKDYLPRLNFRTPLDGMLERIARVTESGFRVIPDLAQKLKISEDNLRSELTAPWWPEQGTYAAVHVNMPKQEGPLTDHEQNYLYRTAQLNDLILELRSSLPLNQEIQDDGQIKDLLSDIGTLLRYGPFLTSPGIPSRNAAHQESLGNIISLAGNPQTDEYHAFIKAARAVYGSHWKGAYMELLAQSVFQPTEEGELSDVLRPQAYYLTPKHFEGTDDPDMGPQVATGIRQALEQFLQGSLASHPELAVRDNPDRHDYWDPDFRLRFHLWTYTGDKLDYHGQVRAANHRLAERAALENIARSAMDALDKPTYRISLRTL